MRLSLIIVVACAALAAGCAAPSDEADTSSTIDALSASTNFHPKNECSANPMSPHYIAEIDLSDRAHPRYRIRHTLWKSEGPLWARHEVREMGVLGEQNINIHLRDGTIWKSPDALLARPSSINTEGAMGGEAILRRYEEASARDPWDPLPVPKEILDQAFRVNGDNVFNLLRWEVVLNIPHFPDEVCRQEFYYRN